jgi:hypothetical protein
MPTDSAHSDRQRMSDTKRHELLQYNCSFSFSTANADRTVNRTAKTHTCSRVTAAVASIAGLQSSIKAGSEFHDWWKNGQLLALHKCRNVRFEINHREVEQSRSAESRVILRCEIRGCCANASRRHTSRLFLEALRKLTLDRSELELCVLEVDDHTHSSSTCRIVHTLNEVTANASAVSGERRRERLVKADHYVWNET